MPWYTDIDSLRSDGFTGFVTIRELRGNELEGVPGEPGDYGVYVVLRIEDGVPFLEVGTGGHFHGLDPNVELDVLQANWILNSQIVYIGKAGGHGVAATLRSRLTQYLNFGEGHAVGHWGGRYIWQLADAEELVVCWKLTPNAVPREVEQQMIEEFREAFDGRPFANLQG